MKSILGIMLLGLVSALTAMVQEVKPGKVEIIDLGNDVKLEMVLIPAGKFIMGSPASEKNRDNDEVQHEVNINKSFYMSKYEVTQEQWEEVMGDNPSKRSKGAKLPVRDVWWDDCQEFIKKLNASTKGGYRLPYDSEWEYTCRAGTSTAYSFGDSLTKSDANIDGESIKEVGSYRPNAFGVYDMHGNVWEWCNDWYGSLQDGEVTDPKGPATGEYRVLRGGSFDLSASGARSSFRVGNAPSARGNGLGFRLARTADLKTEITPTVPKPDPAVVMPASVNLLVAPFSEAKAKEVQKSVAKSLHKEVEEKADLGKGIKLDLVLIPAGKFKMGSPASEKGRNDDEKQHEVTLTKPFYMGKYEVTQEQYEAVMGNNPSSSSKGAKLPITDVSWEDCQEFIKKLNAKTNGGYRLPTEAEWEYSCRAGTTTTYSFGVNVPESDANIGGASIKAVGSYNPNAFGLYDMHGNVWEWCEDWKADYPEGAVTDPKGAETGTFHPLRGGSFLSYEKTARSSDRSGALPTIGLNYYGFRLARTADLKTGFMPFTEAEAKEVQKEVANILQKKVEENIDLGKGTKLEMVLIPAGKFRMGSPASEKGRNNDETQHEVTLTRHYYIGKHEVTQEQLEIVMGDNKSEKTNKSRLPVTDVSWNDCQEFIKKLNAKTNGGYRLPTEAEWEYACRAGTISAYSYGDNITKNDANYYDGSNTNTKEVGSFKPNAFGLCDMHGNVWEWCEDWYEAYPAGLVTDPKGLELGESRVLRGGSFFDNGSAARSSDRFYKTPTTRVNYLGFRLVRDP